MICFTNTIKAMKADGAKCDYLICILMKQASLVTRVTF